MMLATSPALRYPSTRVRQSSSAASRWGERGRDDAGGGLHGAPGAFFVGVEADVHRQAPQQVHADLGGGLGVHCGVDLAGPRSAVEELLDVRAHRFDWQQRPFTKIG